MLFDAIPAELNKNASRYQVSSVIAGEKEERVREILADMQDSMTVYISYHVDDPGAGMSLHKDRFIWCHLYKGVVTGEFSKH